MPFYIDDEVHIKKILQLMKNLGSSNEKNCVSEIQIRRDLKKKVKIGTKRYNKRDVNYDVNLETFIGIFIR